MALVYPVHVVVDHSGLFGHHEHSHHHGEDDHHPAQPLPEEELCALCLTLSSMETSESMNPASVIDNEPYVAASEFTDTKKTVDSPGARAPPDYLLILA